MAELRVVHTAELTGQERRAVRVLLDDAFGGEFGEADHEHVLGGLHALVSEEGVLVAHGSVVMRRLLHDGRALRTGYVEGVAVRADQRGRGHGAAVMTELEHVVRQAYELGALSATEEAAAFYERRGWQRWQGTASVLTPRARERTPEDEGGIYLLPVDVYPEDGDLACDWRGGDVW